MDEVNRVAAPFRAVMRFPTLQFDPGRVQWLLGATSRPVARVLALAALFGALAVAAGMAIWWHTLSTGVDQRLQQWTAARSLATATAVPQSAATVPAAERARINQVVRRLNTPWPLVLGVLEQAASPDVALLSVEPDLERGAMRVQAEGRSLDALLAHADRLQQATGVAHVQLLRIEKDSQAAPAAPRLTFDVVLAR
ncbi:hypothetical protein HLB44_19320 [Aquincola sp. S2]|uniref:Fimbrial assembly protein n=1 Tax=Pseudaquabacterium terrae TaxID=2732868 RepID=A0ABX2EKF9_9BURK|nr:hypothetical protein [Aquabacterium terrae]NRF69150.1 hypothetical protein [Aquabacterium terrae]